MIMTAIPVTMGTTGIARMTVTVVISTIRVIPPGKG